MRRPPAGGVMAECETINSSGFVVHKKRYGSRKKAKQARHRTARLASLPTSCFDIYKCTVCGHYHVGRNHKAHRHG